MRSTSFFCSFTPKLGLHNAKFPNTRGFTSTVLAKASLPSSQRVMLNTLTEMKHDKWGFVIYRCTYRDDNAWDHFQQIVLKNSREEMRASDAPELADKLEDRKSVV